MADLLGALGDVGPGTLIPGRLATLATAAAAQPQIVTLGLPKPAQERSPLDILIDGIPFKLYVAESAQGMSPASANEAAYTAEEVEPLLPRIGSGGVLTYADLPARDEIVVAQDNWTAGLSPVREQRVDATYWTAQGVDARQPQQLVIQPQKQTIAQADGSSLAGAPVRQVDFGGGVYLIAGNKMYRLLVGTPPAWSAVLTAAAGIFTDLVVFDNLLLAAVSGGNGYYYSTDGAAFTQVTGAVDAPKADLFAVVRFQLWKAVKPNKIYSCTDPTNPANWTSTPTQIGDKARNINAISAWQIDVAIGKEDGLWTVDRTGNDFPVVPELRAVADPSNCLTMKQWRSGLHFRVRNGLFRYDGGRLLSVGLDRYRAPTGAGQIPQALSVVDTAPYLNEMIVALTAAGQQGIFLGSLQETPWRWHLWGFDARYKATSLAVSANAFSSPTLWVGQDDGAGNYSTGYVRLPSATDNPLDDAGYTFQPGSWTFTTCEITPLPDQDKNWARLMLKCFQGSAQATVAVSYAADQDIDTQTFTAMVGPDGQTTQYSLLQEWLFPAGTIGVNARSIQFRVTLTTSDPAQSPAIRHLVAHFKHMAFPRNRFQVAVLCEDRAAGPDWQLDSRSAEDLFFELVRMRVVRKPVSFVGVLGEKRTVYLERLNHKLLELLPGHRSRIVATCQMLEAIDTIAPAGPPADPN